MIKRLRPGPSLRHEINVTPFVDVMLVLLVIFMVAAPMMSTGVSVDLPRGKSAPALPDVHPVTIVLNKKGHLFLQDKQLSYEQLVISLKKLPESATERLYLRADRDLPYEKVIDLMTHLARAGFTRIALVTDSTGHGK